MSNKTNIYILGLTIIIGFLPMFLFAVNDGTVIGSHVDFPLIKYTSIYIGDFLLLPFFNLFFCRFYKKLSIETKNKYYKIIISSFVSILSSLWINYYTHFQLWTKDNLDSFMDINNNLTGSGYTHFIYSTIQMAVVLFFIIFTIWNYSIKFEKDRSFIASRKLLLIFTLLQIPDFIIRNWNNTSNGENLIDILSKDYSSLLTIPSVLILLWIIPYLKNTLTKRLIRH